jgi:hypothetical protein
MSLGCFNDDVGRHVISCFERLAANLDDLSLELGVDGVLTDISIKKEIFALPHLLTYSSANDFDSQRRILKILTCATS